MKTQKEIADRVSKLGKSDFFGFRAEVLIGYLGMELLVPFLKEGARKRFEEDKENPWTDPVFTEDEVKKDMLDYLKFAFEKCLDHRGISANRSIEKLVEWAWILGRDDLVEFAGEAGNFRNYGAPVLKKFAEGFEIELPEDERFHRMARGERCGADYACGCNE